jgi:hypothetical protein
MMELIMDEIVGFLTCKRCGSVIVGDGYESGHGYTAHYITKAIQEHHCSLYVAQFNGVKWPYDWNSPLTIDEQWNNYIARSNEMKAHPINIPTHNEPTALDLLYKGSKEELAQAIERGKDSRAQRITAPPQNDHTIKQRTVWDE